MNRGSELLSDRRRWMVAVFGLTLLAVLVRILIIAHSRGGDDLRMYTYFSRLPLHGINPFSAPVHGTFPPADSNNPPVEVAVFTGLLKLHNSPTTLRLLFVLADAAALLIIGLWFPRSRGWRLTLILFLAFNPFSLFAFTAFAEDKTLLFLGIAVWILALERGSEVGTWVSAAALAVFKFLGSFAAPALALRSWRTQRRRAAVLVAGFVTVFLLGNLPWFPASLHAWSRRNMRLGIDPPIHASPMLLLSRIGIYSPTEVKLALVVSILTVLALYAVNRLEIRATVIWSIFAGYIFLPDNAFNRLLLITLPFLLILDLSWRRWLVLWVTSAVVALAAIVATRGVPHELHFAAGLLEGIFGRREATVRHVLWMNLFPVVVVIYYFIDRRGERASIPPRTQDLHSSAPTLTAGR